MVSQGILKYCLRGCSGDDQRLAVFKFFDVCAKLCAEKQASKCFSSVGRNQRHNGLS